MLSTTKPTEPAAPVASTPQTNQTTATTPESYLMLDAAEKTLLVSSLGSAITATLMANVQVLRPAEEYPARDWRQLQVRALENTGCGEGKEDKAMMEQGKEASPLWFQELAKELSKVISDVLQPFEERLKARAAMRDVRMSHLEAEVDQLRREIHTDMDNRRAAMDNMRAAMKTATSKLGEAIGDARAEVDHLAEQGVHRLRSDMFRQNRDIADLEISEEGDLVPLVHPV